MYNCFATTSRGLEPLLHQELASFGAKNIEIVNAGAKFDASLDLIMQLNLSSRIASRILLKLISGEYTNENDIYDLAYEINWPEWFNSDKSIKVATTAIRSNLNSLEFITLLVKDAICDHFVANNKLRPNVNKYNPDMRIYNFLTQTEAIIYLDTSGEALFKRGYRENKLEAPLKENLAAGILQLSNWTPEQPLYDPMCGSGTIAIEALLSGLNIAPGLNRGFAFEKLVNHDSKKWQHLKNAATDIINLKSKLQIYASDINYHAIKIAENNLQQLKLPAQIKFSVGDILQQKSPASHGIMITNPPYGVRLAETEQLAEFYPKLSTCLKQNYANWNCYFLSGDLSLPKLMRLKPSKKTPLFNGDLECRLFEFKMVAGSNR